MVDLSPILPLIRPLEAGLPRFRPPDPFLGPESVFTDTSKSSSISSLSPGSDEIDIFLSSSAATNMCMADMLEKLLDRF